MILVRCQTRQLAEVKGCFGWARVTVGLVHLLLVNRIPLVSLAAVQDCMCTEPILTAAAAAVAVAVAVAAP